MASLLRVFVASPSDVEVERTALEQVVNELNDIWGTKKGLLLQVLDWRRHVTKWLGSPPEQTVLSELPVETWDVFVGIMWSRIGTPTGEFNPTSGQPYKSGTEQEFILALDSFRERGFPRILFYKCERDVKINTDLDQLKAVNTFFKEFELGGKYHGLYTSFTNLDDFKSKARHDLESALFDFEKGFKPVPQTTVGVQKEWLQRVGLSGNPFTYSDAGKDASLPEYFHIMFSDDFGELLGASSTPQSSIVFGKHGMGKTAIRQKIANESVRSKLGGRKVLSVLYTDFSSLAEKLVTGQSITPRDHVEQILMSCIQSLGVALERGFARLDPGALNESRMEFSRYLRNFEQKLSEAQRRLLWDIIDINEGSPAQELGDSYVEIFYGFCRAVRIFGYDIAYILVDEVDECALLDDEEKVVAVLIPLLSDLKLMDPPESLATFRFFLPDYVEGWLKRDVL